MPQDGIDEEDLRRYLENPQPVQGNKPIDYNDEYMVSLDENVEYVRRQDDLHDNLKP